jgi:hypothetical protein
MRAVQMSADMRRVEIGGNVVEISTAKSPLKPALQWRQVAGPPLTPSQLHCATVPDGPGCQWKGGAFERIEAESRKILDEHFAAMATDQCATCGTGEDLVDHKPDRTRPERTVTLCRACRDKRTVAIGARATELIATKRSAGAQTPC